MSKNSKNIEKAEVKRLKAELEEEQRYLNPMQVKSLSRQLRDYKKEILASIRSSIMELFKYSKLNTERDAYDKVLALIDKEMKA